MKIQGFTSVFEIIATFYVAISVSPKLFEIIGLTEQVKKIVRGKLFTDILSKVANSLQESITKLDKPANKKEYKVAHRKMLSILTLKDLSLDHLESNRFLNSIRLGYVYFGFNAILLLLLSGLETSNIPIISKLHLINIISIVVCLYLLLKLIYLYRTGKNILNWNVVIYIIISIVFLILAAFVPVKFCEKICFVNIDIEIDFFSKSQVALAVSLLFFPALIHFIFLAILNHVKIKIMKWEEYKEAEKNVYFANQENLNATEEDFSDSIKRI